MGNTISIIGAGSWGTALAILLSKNGHQVYLWHRNKKFIEELKINKENKKYLPNVDIPKNIIPTDNLNCVKKSNIIILAVASQAIREICKSIKPLLNDSQILVNVAKGLEYKTLNRMSEVIYQELPNNSLMTLSGPSHAEEVARDIPTTVVLAGKNRKETEMVQDVFMSSIFRVYTNPDIIGVELGGALKNIIALGAGISDGLGYGDNTRAALMSRGIVEISRLGQAMGANISTFAGLSGIGDLIVTCTSKHSRNRRAGIQLGQGNKVEDVLDNIGMVVEGIRTTYVAYNLSKKLNIEMPITTELYNVLYNNVDVNESVNKLMLRSKTHEMEEVVLDTYNGW
jgi:glycerol-3-phosphate dehydrogenase (NAD(P)+)